MFFCAAQLGGGLFEFCVADGAAEPVDGDGSDEYPYGEAAENPPPHAVIVTDSWAFNG